MMMLGEMASSRRGSSNKTPSPEKRDLGKRVAYVTRTLSHGIEPELNVNPSRHLP